MYPNMMHPIPFMKHKSKHPSGVPQDKANTTSEKSEVKDEKKEDNINENNIVDSQNQMEEEPKQE